MRLISFDKKVNIPFELTFICCDYNRVGEYNEKYPYQIVGESQSGRHYILGKYSTTQYRDYVMNILELANMANKTIFYFPDEGAVRDDLGEDEDADN
jgi:hypothetical protein